MSRLPEINLPYRDAPGRGIDESNLAAWVAAGAGGAGIGGTLYKPGHSPAEVGTRAQELMSVWQQAAN